MKRPDSILTAIIYPFPKLDWHPVGDGYVPTAGRISYQIAALAAGALHWNITRHNVNGATEAIGYARTLYGAQVMAEDDWKRPW
jgi:hypothetical protein